MTTRLLFPHKYRLIGWLIFVPSALLGLATMYQVYEISWLKVGPIDALFGTTRNNLTNEVAGLGIISGLLLIAFSKEKVEDEMSNHLRLEALQWSVYVNYLVLAVAIVLVYNLDFLNVLVYNMFTLLLVFIARYRWLVWKNESTLSV